ncbi:MAG TPA: cold shock domain-containing protein [bacterium]|nr:cold shock domain-containing protein [bacterium]HNT64767.1 cold shock domain-containing protein [bacterium]
MKNGSIRYWDPGKGYGFIATDEGDELFFHVSELEATLAPNAICAGLRVRFDIRSELRGDKAIRVRKA